MYFKIYGEIKHRLTMKKLTGVNGVKVFKTFSTVLEIEMGSFVIGQRWMLYKLVTT